MRDDLLERAHARVGMTLKDKWHLDHVVGVGGIATVYAATHRNKSRVAIKLLHEEIALDREVTTRFAREGYVANTVEHSGTVRVFDDDRTEDGLPFLVMELLEGETVDERWERKNEQLPLHEVLPLAEQLLDVLAAAHDVGVVHRDLKPENLFLTVAGELKVLDFGIARLHEVSQDASTTTQVGALLGTPAFMAPEQALGRLDRVNHRTDIWAAGATLFTLLTGRFVHEAETVNEQLILAATKTAPPIDTVMPGLPREVASLVDKALSFEMDQRFVDARSMLAAVKAAIDGGDFEDSMHIPRPSVVRQPVPMPTLTSKSNPDEYAQAVTTGGAPQSLGPKLSVTPTTSTPIIRSAPPPTKRRVWPAAVVALCALLGTMVVVLMLRTPPDRPAAEPAAQPAATGQMPVVEATPPASPSAEETAGVAASPEPSPSAEPAPKDPKPVARKPVRPTGVATKPVPTVTKPTARPVPVRPPIKTAPVVNPFDRRH